MKFRQRLRLPSRSRPHCRCLVPASLTSTLRSLSSLWQSLFRLSSTSRRPLSPSRASSGANKKSSTAVRTAPSRHPTHATVSRNDFDSDSTRPAPHASFSTLEAQSSHLISAPEDIRKRKSKTCSNFISFITHVAIAIPITIYNPVFDPGGQASSSRLFSAHEDVRKLKPKTRGFLFTHDAALSLPIPVPIDHLIVFDPGGGAFVLEPAHEDLVTLDKDAQ
ncbi:hypothetical protein EDB83DRAFT_1936262 [Lactarius deliciosus]|nr:hypothetical protein EDB83DRAFT_1936262 [Lactarius deliciosus]